MHMTHARVLLIDPACIKKGRGVLVPCPSELLVLILQCIMNSTLPLGGLHIHPTRVIHPFLAKNLDRRIERLDQKRRLIIDQNLKKEPAVFIGKTRLIGEGGGGGG